MSRAAKSLKRAKMQTTKQARRASQYTPDGESRYARKRRLQRSTEEPAQ